MTPKVDLSKEWQNTEARRVETWHFG